MTGPDDDGVHAGAAPAGDEGPPGPLTDLLAQVAGPSRMALPAGWGAALLVGTTVGRFEILRELGRGGFGVVYEARDHQLGRPVAFKVLLATRASQDREARGRLQAEAEAGARLSHPNIVSVFDVDLLADPPHLVLELLRGETLAQRLRRGPLPLDEALRIAVEIGRALEHAHRAGVIHRDLKPSNAFLTQDGRVKVLDFGLAQVVGIPGPHGGGTPGYMAPEQWREELQDPRTDVFAAATMLYESISGRLPYRMLAGRSEVLDPGPPPPPLRRAPRPLDRLLRRALSRRPADRPGTGHQWLDALLAIQRRLATTARWKARPGLLLGAVALLASVALGSRWLAGAWREERAREAAFWFEKARAAQLGEGDPSDRAEATRAALRRVADLAPREQSLLRAWEERLRGDDEAALARYDQLLQADPADREVAYLGGDLRFHQGRFEAAVPWLEIAAEGDHPGDWALDHLAISLHELGRREELARLGRRLAGRPPTAATLHAQSIAWGSIGEQAASLAAARRELQAGGGALALDDLAASLFQGGDLARAEALLRERLSLEGAGRLDARHALAVVLGAEGRWREGLAVWDASAAEWGDDLSSHRVLRAAFQAGQGDPGLVWRSLGGTSVPRWAAFDLALTLALLGDEAHLAHLAPQLEPLERQACEAVGDARRGRPAEAARALEAIVGAPGWRHGALALPRAEVALAAGRPRDAATLLAADRTRYRRLPLGMSQAWMLPRGLYVEAQAHERLGERREALAVIDRLLSSWRDADPGQRLQADAQALRARLEGRR